jgi:hypothetical protein
MKTIDVEIMDTDLKTSIIEHGFKVQNTKQRYLATNMS